MMAFIYLVAFEAILLGVFLVMLGYKVRQATTREWMLYVTGALSILFGVLVVANPVRGGLSIVLVIAAWAIVIGTFKILFGFRVRPSRSGSARSSPACAERRGAAGGAAPAVRRIPARPSRSRLRRRAAASRAVRRAGLRAAHRASRYPDAEVVEPASSWPTPRDRAALHPDDHVAGLEAAIRGHLSAGAGRPPRRGAGRDAQHDTPSVPSIETSRRLMPSSISMPSAGRM